jgi:hypothetical protein
VKRPDPLVIGWQGQQVRVRHDDPHLTPYSPRASVIRAAAELVSDVDGPSLTFTTARGDRCTVRVGDDGDTVGLWRR